MVGKGCCGVLLAVCGLGMAAVGQAPSMPRPVGGVHVHVEGIYVTPVPNSPFTATEEIVSHQRMEDGTEHVLKTETHIARTTMGEVRRESRRLMPADFQGSPELLGVHLYDPTTRQSIHLEPARRLAREVTLRAPERTPERALGPAQRPMPEGETESSLGTQTMDGLELVGSRRTRTVSAERSGTGKPVEVTDEAWYSPELSIYVVVRHNDPRSGEQLVAVTKVQRTEPPAALFAIPEGYKVVDETTDASPMAAR